ncbi:hypothetical protein [Sinorhizobium meliloti]|uniref:hypothetical protein n=1 Tax=Rhizobium meliloti TaxID=382 RepID=UPI000FDC4B23|nr:hypothetical protein [Sinorhizobium meliloti]RVM04157.1 hypothetical protein CN134_32120 [Sinorhizobium meliloti]RVO21846.1 hypothetical protein CN098_32600 [Sinorhizobium meliloti]
MSYFHVLAACAVIVLITLLSTIAFVPSFSTIDISAETEVLQFDTAPGAVLEESTFGIENATVCSFATTNHQTGPCPDGRKTIVEAFTGSVTLAGRVRVAVRRTRQVIELVAQPLDNDAKVLVSGTPLPSGVFTVMAASESFRKPISFGMSASAISIGWAGYNQPVPAWLLIEGKIRTIANSSLGGGVIFGPSLDLGLGDRLTLRGESGGKGSMFVRVEGNGPIKVAARYPTTGVLIERYGDTKGIPLEFSWWERIKADPVLIGIWAFIGFWIALLGVVQKVWEAAIGKKP